MKPRLELKRKQPAMVEHMMQHKRCGVWAQMGTGKTSATLLALDRLNWTHEVWPALVLAPLRVAQTTWPEEVAKWKDFEHLTIAPIVGDAAQRRQAVATQKHIYTTNYEQVPNLVKMFGAKWPFKSVIADEATRLKSFRLQSGGKRAEALNSVAWLQEQARFIELSGTPSPNGLADLYGQVWFLDKGQRLGQSFTAFKERWFQRSFDGHGVSPLPHALDDIQERVKDICVSFLAENIEKPFHFTVEVNLPDKVRSLYKEMEREMVMEIQGKNIEAMNAAVRTNKCLQIANGAVYMDEKRTQFEELHREKLEALESIVEEAAGMPLLVAYNFRCDLERLKKHFPRGRFLDKSPATIRDWNAGKIPLLFAHPASAGHGLNLQYGSNILVFFGHNWNLEEYEQIIERIGPMRQMQAGLNRPVFIYHIVAKNTIEEEVIWRLSNKAAVQEALMRAVSRHAGV